MENYVLNPISNRPILFNGAIYRRLLKNNLIQPVSKKEKKKKNMSDDTCNEEEDKTDDEDITIQELFNKLNSKQ